MYIKKGYKNVTNVMNKYLCGKKKYNLMKKEKMPAE